MDHLRPYGDELAVVTVTRSPGADPGALAGSVRAATARPVRVVVADTAGATVPAGAEAVRIAEDVGRSAAVNRAVAALDPAVGWVALADPASRWGPGALDALLDAARRHPRAGALGPRMRDRAGAPLPCAGALPSVRDALRGHVAGGAAAGPTGWVSASCVLLRRAAWDSVDGLDPRYVGDTGLPDMAGVDLGDRLGRAGWLVVHVPAAEVTVELATGAARGQGILEPPRVGARRYAADRGGVPVRALLALARYRRA